MRALAALVLILAGCASQPKHEEATAVPMVPVAACVAEIDRLNAAGTALARKFDEAREAAEAATHEARECWNGRST